MLIGTVRRTPAWALGLLLASCTAEDPQSTTSAPLPAATDPPATRAITATGPAAPSEPQRSFCPADMVPVEGLFCPEVAQECLEHDPEYLGDPSTSERCTRYAEPTRCLSAARQALRFCVDRYEWPNRKGALPAVLVDWHQATAACESIGKRLCDEKEWLFACEGEEMLPYVYGYLRDPTRCVIDRLYVERPTEPLLHHDECMASPKCRAAFGRLDQREPAGDFAECGSPFGVYDMNGNVNEWVRRPDQRPPRRSGLKGGWWGPVRNRCRPTVGFHDENDWGYEIGFRCCREPLN